MREVILNRGVKNALIVLIVDVDWNFSVKGSKIPQNQCMNEMR